MLLIIPSEPLHGKTNLNYYKSHLAHPKTIICVAQFRSEFSGGNELEFVLCVFVFIHLQTQTVLVRVDINILETELEPHLSTY